MKKTFSPGTFLNLCRDRVFKEYFKSHEQTHISFAKFFTFT